jgi:hypothetical protein
MTIRHDLGGSAVKIKSMAQDGYARRQYVEKHFPFLKRWAMIAALAFGYGLRAVVGGRERAHAHERRTACRAALATLFGKAPAPYAEPPRHAVAPDRTPFDNRLGLEVSN